MLEREIVMGGEESGGIGFQRHLPERDGLLNALLLANVMAEEGKTLGQLVADLQEEYGEHQYGRIDLHIPDDMKKAAIARAHDAQGRRPRVWRHGHPPPETLDGVKFYLDMAGSEEQAERRRDLDPVPRQRHRAADAHLHRVGLKGSGGEAARSGARVCPGNLVQNKEKNVHSHLRIPLEA